MIQFRIPDELPLDRAAASTLVAAAQLEALRAAPYLSLAIASASVIVTNGLPEGINAASSEGWAIYLSPAAVSGMFQVKELAWAMYHHELWGHCLREHGRKTREAQLIHAAANAAQDLEINQEKPLCGKLPESRGLFPEQFGLPLGHGWRWYYEHLPKKHMCACDCGSASDGRARPWEHAGDAYGAASPARRDAIRKAVAEAARAAGDAPANVLMWADTILAPVAIDWRSALRSAVQAAVGGNAPRPRGIRVKHGLVQDRVRRAGARVAIVADTSGSMAGSGREVLGVIESAARYCARVSVIAIDAAAQAPVRARKGKKAALRGGGGTDLRPGIAAAAKLEPDALLIVTDCETPWPDSPPANCWVVPVANGWPPLGWRVLNARIEG